MDDADGVRALGVAVPVAAEGAGDEHRAVVEVPVLADGVDTSLGRHTVVRAAFRKYCCQF